MDKEKKQKTGIPNEDELLSRKDRKELNETKNEQLDRVSPLHEEDAYLMLIALLLIASGPIGAGIAATMGAGYLAVKVNHVHNFLGTKKVLDKDKLLKNTVKKSNESDKSEKEIMEILKGLGDAELVNQLKDMNETQIAKFSEDISQDTDFMSNLGAIGARAKLVQSVKGIKESGGTASLAEDGNLAKIKEVLKKHMPKKTQSIQKETTKPIDREKSAKDNVEKDRIIQLKKSCTNLLSDGGTTFNEENKKTATGLVAELSALINTYGANHLQQGNGLSQDEAIDFKNQLEGKLRNGNQAVDQEIQPSQTLNNNTNLGAGNTTPLNSDPTYQNIESISGIGRGVIPRPDMANLHSPNNVSGTVGSSSTRDFLGLTSPKNTRTGAGLMAQMNPKRNQVSNTLQPVINSRNITKSR
ncbi:hypothetical protein OAC51_03905 [Flavobacteriaceae bacterium]|nr:hypothetical protein [Flavobacteriaceae bacterium]